MDRRAPQERREIVHVITGLGQGGAEKTLLRVVRGTSDEFRHTIFSLTGLDHYQKELEATGARVFFLNLKGPLQLMRSVLIFSKYLRQHRPLLCQTWLYHADLFGGLVARAVGTRVYWNIRNGQLDRSSKLNTRIVLWICARISALIPERIICNAYSAAEIHQKLGYAKNKFVIVPNGIDFRDYRFDPLRRLTFRQQWSIKDNEILVGYVARWDAQKDHETWVMAFVQTLALYPELRGVFVGNGMTTDNVEVVRMIENQGLKCGEGRIDRIILAGSQSDIPGVMSALDIHMSSSSYGEAFPNVVLEAIACGTMAIATDCGDAARILRDNISKIVPVRNSSVLAENLGLMVERIRSGPIDRNLLRKSAEAYYDQSIMVQSYLDLWNASPEVN